MKRLGAIILLLALLTGCSESESRINRVIALRGRLLRETWGFTAEVTADYGDRVYTFTLECEGDEKVELRFSVAEPQTIAGITGIITGEGGLLTFDDTALHFDPLAEGQISPVSAPWLLVKTLRGGCLTSAGEDGELLRVTIDDSYEEDALTLDIWLDSADIPQRCEILYAGRRIVSMTLRDFRIG